MNDFNLTFPFQKIDPVKRTVTGIATANNVDLVDDEITAEASEEAFAEWIGNIREMHGPKAVGKLVDYRQIPLVFRGDVYKAIEVEVYISKGAQDTWEKITDGTLKGFSVGGKVKSQHPEWDERLGREKNVITKYMLGELSVVDNPCNPAGMFTMIKSAPDGSLVSAFEADMNAVYYCDVHKYAAVDGNNICPTCAGEMSEIGFVETFDGSAINKMIASYELAKGESMTEKLQENVIDAIVPVMDEFTEEQKQTISKRFVNFLTGKDESPVTTATNSANEIHIHLDSITKSVDTTDDVVDLVAEVVSSTDEVIEKVADENGEVESTVDTEEILKGFGALLDEKLELVKTEIEASIDAKIEKSVEAVKAEVDTALENQAEEIAKVADSGAMQKSVSEDEIDEVIEKSVETSASLWGGIFVPGELAKSLGYDS